MSLTHRIYLDNAATSWPKPEGVYRAVDAYQREGGASAGRSAYREALQAAEDVQQVRSALARLLDVDDPNRIVFTTSGTDGLNTAIHGVLRPGDHVVTSVCEHNSVLRPLRHLEEKRIIAVTRVACNDQGIIDPLAVREAIRPTTSLVALIHASNVTGGLQPLEEVGTFLRTMKAVFLVDAAQSLGHLPFSVPQIGADLVAAPGHKGLLGPLGTGVLYVGPGVETQLESLRQGGTGTQSEQDLQPSTLPDKYEAGNLNVAGIVGLGEGVAYLCQQDIQRIRERELERTEQLFQGLARVAGVRLFGPLEACRRVGVVSCRIDGYDPQELAATLDAAYGIQVRAGLHCAPRMHEALGTWHDGGTVRFSMGPFTTEEHITAAVKAVAEIAAQAV